ncbi:MAG: DUF2339 domain-containing protein [Phycisphaerales bacterium]
MYNSEILIVILLILVPAGLLAMLVWAFVMALGARRALREMQGRVTQLQRDVGGLKYQLRERAADSPATAAPKAATPVLLPPAPPPAVVPPIASAPRPSPAPAASSTPIAPPSPVVPSPIPGAAQSKRGIEERLGTQLPIWIGAIALGIGGIWLAKYIIEHSHFGPTVRILGGASLGIAMLAVGVWGHKRNRHIAAAVVAAGIADLYGWVFAAASMYHLIPITLGFGLMIVITALAVGLSLRQGPIIAIVGMVGAFLTPALLHTDSHNPAVFAYLMLLQVGLLVVTRRKGWWPLAALTLAGSLIWAGGWVIGMMLHALPIAHGKWVAMFMLGSAASMVFGADSDKHEAWPVPGVGRVLGWISAIASLVILAMVVQVTDFTGQQWAFMGILAAGCMGLGRLRKPYEALAWLAEATVLALVTMWAMQVNHASADHWPAMRWTTLAFGALFAFGAYVCAWNSSKPARWFGMSAGSAVAWFVLAYYAPFPLPEHWRWWMAALIVAGALAILCVPVQLRRAKITGGDESLAWLLIGVSVMLAIAAALGLHRQNITIAWALEVAAVAWIGCGLRVPRLRWMAAGIALGVIVRLVLNPHVLDYDIAQRIVFNWLSYGYGVPIIAFALASWIYSRHKADEPPLRLLLEGGAVLLGFMLVSLQIRHGFHPTAMKLQHASLIELATYCIAWLTLAGGLFAAGRQWTQSLLDNAGLVIGVIAVIAVIVGLIGVKNPMWAHESVGAMRVFNRLLFVYGLPMLLTGAFGWLMRNRNQGVGVLSGVVSLVLLWLLVSLQVRQWFQGEFLDARYSTHAEQYAYSAAWVLLGLGLLAAGIVVRGKLVRFASLTVMLLAVCKVFLFDTRHLSDLYRVFSFLGLGVSLLLLAFLYQRFVFRRTSPVSRASNEDAAA